MSDVRRLEEDEIDFVLGHVAPFLRTGLPPAQYKEFSDYFVEAMKQNEFPHKILTWEKMKWIDALNYRHGAESVIGTIREFIVIAIAYKMGYSAEFIHGEHDQVIRGRDLYIHTPTRVYAISVKPKAGKGWDNTRLGQEFFNGNKPNLQTNYDSDVIAIVDFDTFEVKFFDFPWLKLYFNDCRNTEHRVGKNENDRYMYTDSAKFYKAKL